MPIRLRHLLVTGTVLLSFAAGWLVAYRSSSHRHSKILAMSRNFLTVDMYTNPVPVLASVTLQRDAVQLEIEVTTDYGTGHKTRALGSATSIGEAVQKWSLIDWRADGLHVGRGTNELFMRKAELEEGWR